MFIFSSLGHDTRAERKVKDRFFALSIFFFMVSFILSCIALELFDIEFSAPPFLKYGQSVDLILANYGAQASETYLLVVQAALASSMALFAFVAACHLFSNIGTGVQGVSAESSIRTLVGAAASGIPIGLLGVFIRIVELPNEHIRLRFQPGLLLYFIEVIFIFLLSYSVALLFSYMAAFLKRTWGG
ncbi:MAG: hypothetical protein JKY00_00360 [Roseicyclus sp.]|nr:hypothetical protein [Roseicyclus sp.]